MRVQTVARRCTVPDTVLRRAEEQAQRLSRFDPSVQAAEIIFESEGHRKSVEGILTRDGDTSAVARGQDSEFRPALDQMLDRLRRILRRSRSQTTDHRGPRLSDVMESDLPTEPTAE